MPRYFFHILQQGKVIADHEGSEMPNLEWAKSEAVASAKDVARQDIAEGASLQGACIEIHDEQGRVLASVGIHEVLDNPQRPQFDPSCDPPNTSRRLH